MTARPGHGRVVHAQRLFYLNAILHRDGVEAAREAAAVLRRFDARLRDDPEFRRSIEALAEWLGDDPERIDFLRVHLGAMNDDTDGGAPERR